MRFSVRHEMVYRYSAPIRLGTHRLRLTPRDDAGRLFSHDLTVDPRPVARRELRDDHGNPLVEVDFAGETESLRVVTRFEIETLAPPAPPRGLPRLPWSPDLAPEAAAHLAAPPPAPAVAAFSASLASEALATPDLFLDALNRKLFERTHRHIRPEGNAQSPEETLATARGACRDLAVLFIAAARAQGIPARFASGYQAKAESVDGRRHLHAWPEAFLPGLGWRGWDPTHGVRVEDGHVALCAAPGQAGTMPLEGGFWGPPVASTLGYAIDIEIRD